MEGNGQFQLALVQVEQVLEPVSVQVEALVQGVVPVLQIRSGRMAAK